MKIRFVKNTYIRSRPDDLTVPPLGVVYAGAVLEVEDEGVRGTDLDGNALWYRDGKDWFYWSGGTEVIPEDTPVAPQAPGIPAELPDLKEPETSLPIPEPVTDEPAADRQTEPSRPVADLTYDERSMNWGIRTTGVLEHAWNARRLTGKGIKVALLDTGIDFPHADLEGVVKVMKNFDGSKEWNKVTDTDGNGTMCAGIIGASGKGRVYGVAPGVELYIGKINEYFYEFDYDHLIAGIQWASQIPADIIFTSVNIKASAMTGEQMANLQKLIDALAQLGIAFVAAAGNGVGESPEDRYPAAFDHVLSVGAYDQNGRRLPTSVKSKQLDLLAPGEKLLTTALHDRVDRFGGSTAAAAFTAGVVALAMDHVRSRGLRLTTPDLLDLIRKSALAPDPTTKCKDLEYGCGRLEVKGLLELLDRQGD